MKRTLYVICILVVAIIIIGGCAKTDVKKPADFFPLTKGSTWKYLGEGNEYASFTREVLFTKDERAQIQEDNGGTVISKVYNIKDNEIVLIFSREESYDETNFLDQDPNEDLIVLQAPIEVGTKWEHSTGTREIIDVSTTVDTPAGTFENCIVVEITTPNATLFEYYKEGIGMVKREFKSEDILVTSVLEKVNINIGR